MPAEPASRGGSLVTSIKKLKKAVLAQGLVPQAEFVERQANDVTVWNADAPRTKDVVKIISRK